MATNTLRHTPGPWVWFEDDGRTPVDLTPDEDGYAHLPECAMLGDTMLMFNGEPENRAADARLVAAAPDLLAACKAQHEAIDRLFALLIEKVPGFLPTKSGQPWKACVQGNAAIKKSEVA